MSSVELQVLDDPAAAAAELLAHAVRRGGHVAVAGGSTVVPVFRRVAELAPDWSTVDLWWGDERAVAPDDERSNFLLARTELLDRLQTPPRVVHRIEGELGAEEAAGRYDAALAGVPLGLAVNGIGADGHTASLFPNGPELDERARRVVATTAQLEPFVPRVSLSIPAFEATGLLVYVAVGANKAEAVRRAFAEEPSPATPASLVRGRQTLALVDAAAASQL